MKKTMKKVMKKVMKKTTVIFLFLFLLIGIGGGAFFAGCGDGDDDEYDNNDNEGDNESDDLNNDSDKPDESPPYPDGCVKDFDCKEDRLCVEGKCIEPDNNSPDGGLDSPDGGLDDDDIASDDDDTAVDDDDDVIIDDSCYFDADCDLIPCDCSVYSGEIIDYQACIDERCVDENSCKVHACCVTYKVLLTNGAGTGAYQSKCSGGYVENSDGNYVGECESQVCVINTYTNVGFCSKLCMSGSCSAIAGTDCFLFEDVTTPWELNDDVWVCLPSDHCDENKFGNL